MNLLNEVTKYIEENYKGKLIDKETAMRYCINFNFYDGKDPDEVVTMTEGYMNEQELLGIYLFDENDYPDREYKELPVNTSLTKPLLFVESRDKVTIDNTFMNDPFNIYNDKFSRICYYLYERFGNE